jgi:ElaB/YqjD/DUF883 family membrane-anchored ribosome-binding protein
MPDPLPSDRPAHACESAPPPTPLGTFDIAPRLLAEIKHVEDAMSDKTTERMEDAAEAVENKAAAVADRAIDTVKQSAEHKALDGQDKAGRFIGASGDAVEAGSSSFDNSGYHAIAGYGRSAVKMIRALSDEAQSFDTKGLIDDAEDLVRRNPIATYGALALAGFAIAAFVKRQNAHRHSDRYESDPHATYSRTNGGSTYRAGYSEGLNR